MLKELMQYVVGLAPATKFINADGAIFYDKAVHPEPHPLPKPLASALQVSSLTSFVDYLAANIDGLDFNTHLIHVAGPDSVELVSCLDAFDRQRETPIAARYKSPAADVLEKWVDLETFTIGLMTVFTAQGDRDDLLALLKSVSRENAEIRDDNGLAQSVNTKAGVKTLGVGKTANPYQLAPYRIFPEIEEQIVSPYVLRLRDGGAAGLQAIFIPADGGAWRVAGAKAVAERVSELLDDYFGEPREDGERAGAPRVIW